ncbi:MAG TPA: hypothetical protein VGX48_24500 [Pyrinomonadaceae bacterium]|nr:hypothetical protein [Pyrinomonadaceae bacterium]
MKKIIGPFVFALTLTAAVALTALLVAPAPAPLPPASYEPLPAPAAREIPVFFKPRYVTLDFVSRKSYVTLELERDTTRPAPGVLWVWAYFFTPNGSGDYCAGDPVEVRQPFAAGDRATVIAEASAFGCPETGTPAKTYYARIFVSTESSFAARATEPRVSFDTTSATPVMVQGASGRR